MKHLVNTNLTEIGKFDFGNLYTPDVKKSILDYVNGKDGSSPCHEQKYVYEKFKASIEELPKEITVLPRFDTASLLAQGYKTVYVDCKSGDDSNDGISLPVATLERALALAKENGGEAICIATGDYSVSDTLTVDCSLGGTPERPFIIKANGHVTLSSAKSIPFSAFAPIEKDDEIALRMPKHAKSKVLFADLKKLGWSDAQIGGITVYKQQEDIGVVDKLRTPTLYCNGKCLDLARFPNASKNDFDLLYFEAVDECGSVIDKNGSRLYSRWVCRVRYYCEYRDFLASKREEPDWEIYYTYMGKPTKLYETKEEAQSDFEKLSARVNEGYAPFIDRYGNYNMDLGFTIRMSPNEQSRADIRTSEEDIECISKWKSISDRDVMIFGNAYEGWDYNRYIVRSVEKKDGYYALTTKGGSSWGAAPSANSPTRHNTYYIYNAIEALDVPGEWYVDTRTGRLYIYPTEEMKTARLEYAANVCDILRIDASFVIVDGLCIDKGSNKGIVADCCGDVVIQNCTVTNMNEAGIELNDTENCAVIYNSFKYNRYYSVCVYGQDHIMQGRAGCNLVQNNTVDSPVNTQLGINICGYLNCASHNTLKMSNLLISGGGRVSLENIIEYNDIPGGHTSVSDAGLIYMNQFYARGTHVRYNYMHSWHAPGNGVYLDDLNSGNYIYCNVIDTTEAKNLKAKGFVYSSSGHDHVIYNNFCIGRAKIAKTVKGTDGSTHSSTENGIISSSAGEITRDGKYPFTVKIGDKQYTVLTDIEDRITSRVYYGVTEIEDGRRLEVWSVKTSSDTDGDSVSFTIHEADGSSVALSNFNDRINQSWMYLSDGCWLGYRFYGFADKFYADYSGFTCGSEHYARRFPELYTYLDLYKQYIDRRDCPDYRINPLEIFIRSAAMNVVKNNIVLGVPKPFERGNATAHAYGVDANGNEKCFVSVHTDFYDGNFDVNCDGYESLKAKILEYQEKETDKKAALISLMQEAEKAQAMANPEYKSLICVVERAGVTF